jgi:K+-sensing histidine kinase KdpD
MPEGREGVINRPFLRYTIAVLAIVVAFLLRQAMVGHLRAELPHYLTFYPAVMLVALLVGLGPGLLATVVAALLTVYWILPPQGQFAIAKTSDAVALFLFCGMGAFITWVAELYRRARRKAAAYDKELALRGVQEALRQSEERLRGAAMAAEIGVWN